VTRQPRPTARCRRLLLELSRYLDGDLTPARRRMIEQHLEGCDCCETMATRLRKTVAACRTEGSRPPPRQVMARAAARIRALIDTEGPLPATPAQRRRDAAKRTGG
jgi:anti-sigma factor RsiW